MPSDPPSENERHDRDSHGEDHRADGSKKLRREVSEPGRHDVARYTAELNTVSIARRCFWPALVCLAVYGASPHAFFLDDGYISVHSADVVLSGSDPIFNAPALVGVTSPLYVAILVALRRIGFTDLGALRVAGSLGATLFLFGLWRLGSELSLSRRAALIFVVLTSGYCWLQLTNGLETGWAMGMLVWLLVAARARRLALAGVLAGLLPFLRPDLALTAGAIVIWSSIASSWRDRLLALAIVVAVSTPWLLWMHHSTGSWVPQTIEAKRLFFAEGCKPLSAKAMVAVSGVLIALVSLLPLALGAVGLFGETLGILGSVTIVATLAVYAIELPGAVFHNYFRYIYPVLVPWLVYGSVRMLPQVSTALVVVVAGVSFGLLPIRHFREDGIARESITAAEAVDRQVPDGAVVLVHDAGAISVFAHRRAVDLVGLKSPKSVAANARWTWPSCGADRADAIVAIVKESGARYLVTIGFWEDTYGIVSGLQARGVVLEAIRRPPTPSGYTIWRLVSAPGFALLPS